MLVALLRNNIFAVWQVNEELRVKLKAMREENKFERNAMETLKMKLSQSVKHAEMTLSVERRLGGELKVMNGELEQRCIRQQGDITQLRQKVEQMTAKLNEVSQSNDHETVFQLRQEIEKVTKANTVEVSKLKKRILESEKEIAEYKAELATSSLEMQELRKKLLESDQEKCTRVEEASAELLKEREQSVKLLQSKNKLQAEAEMLKAKIREYEDKEKDSLTSKPGSAESASRRRHSLQTIEEEPSKTTSDAESSDVHHVMGSKQRNTGASTSFFETYFDEPSENRSPASAMIKELLALEFKGEVLSNNQVLEISEKYARTAVGYDRFDEQSARGADSLEIEHNKVVLIPTSQPHEQRTSSTSTKLRPSTELTTRFQRRKTPPKVKKEKPRKSKSKTRKGKAHVKPTGGEAQSRRQTKATSNIENVATANTRQRNTWRY